MVTTHQTDEDPYIIFPELDKISEEIALEVTKKTTLSTGNEILGVPTIDLGSNYLIFPRVVEEQSRIITIDLGGDSKKAGDKTPRGRTYTNHGAHRANERGFSDKAIDDIIDNNAKKRKKEINKDTGEVTWRYQDNRGNTVITDELGEMIVTVYSYPKKKNSSKYIPKGVK